jgi:hypothetical protein
MLAIEAFEDVERVTLLLDKKQAQLNKFHIPEADMREYFDATARIRHEFAEKREKAGL